MHFESGECGWWGWWMVDVWVSEVGVGGGGWWLVIMCGGWLAMDEEDGSRCG